ncbi:hypothetical protein GCM10022214_01630 [Actinomadura miaoliensis]|uniref:Uncharacterized protein n=1 Tax=Actinomadura miaoliensis TaxID=430685 RepID=A0ABP7UYR2_9ACTN
MTLSLMCNGNRIPDKVEKISASLDHAWAYYTGTMGYKIPDDVDVYIGHPFVSATAGLANPTAIIGVPSIYLGEKAGPYYLPRQELFHTAQFDFVPLRAWLLRNGQQPRYRLGEGAENLRRHGWRYQNPDILQWCRVHLSVDPRTADGATDLHRPYRSTTILDDSGLASGEVTVNGGDTYYIDLIAPSNMDPHVLQVDLTVHQRPGDIVATLVTWEKIDKRRGPDQP